MLQRDSQEFGWKKITINSTLPTPLEIKKALSLKSGRLREMLSDSSVQWCTLFPFWRNNGVRGELLDPTPEMYL